MSNIGSGASSTVLQGAGAGQPAKFSTATFPGTATGTGTILRADGTNWVATTSTYPNTNAVNTLLYASSANVMGALATANSGVLTTDASGVPSIDTTNFVRQTTGMQVKGNNTNTAPPAGFLGETIRGYNGSGQSLSNNTVANVTSINLTAGVWDISFIGEITTTGTTTQGQMGISTTNNTQTGSVVDAYVNQGFGSVTGAIYAISIPQYRVLLSGNVTYYLNALALFSTGAATAYGRLSAVRVG